MLEWLKCQEPVSVKDIARTIQALSLWNETNLELIETLLSKKKGGHWGTDKPVLDTARSCSALAGCGIIQPDTVEWLTGHQQNGSWNSNEIESSYALMALGDMGVKNDAGCEWLFNNYGEKWEHVGTTSLIITALFKQDKNKYREFIEERAKWILSKRESGGWVHIATSNLALQALIMCGECHNKDISDTVRWLLGKQDNINWGGITSTSLSLISLRMFLECRL